MARASGASPARRARRASPDRYQVPNEQLGATSRYSSFVLIIRPRTVQRRLASQPPRNAEPSHGRAEAEKRPSGSTRSCSTALGRLSGFEPKPTRLLRPSRRLSAANNRSRVSDSWHRLARSTPLGSTERRCHYPYAVDTNVYVRAATESSFRGRFEAFVQAHGPLVVSSVVIAEVLIGVAETHNAVIQSLSAGTTRLAPQPDDWIAAAVAVDCLGDDAITKSRSFWNGALLAAQCAGLQVSLVTSNAKDFRRPVFVLPMDARVSSLHHTFGYTCTMSSSQSQVSRSNHSVAAGYLAPFTDTGTRKGVLQAYRRPKPTRPLPMTAESVATERDLYTRRTPGGAVDDSLERLFADEVEAPFLKIRNRLLAETTVELGTSEILLTPEERHATALYLAVQHLRTPTERDAANWLSDLAAVSITRDVMAAGAQGRAFFQGLAHRELTEGDFAEITALLTRLASHNAREQGHWLQVGMKLAPRFAELIARLDWHLVATPRGISLPTCDMPLVCVTRGSEPGSFELGGGWAQHGFEATLTLSPSVVLYLTRDVEDQSFLDIEAFAQSVRRRTIAHAREWVYSHILDHEVAQLLAASPRPAYRIELDGQFREPSEAPASIEADLRHHAPRPFKFRYS